MSRARGSREQWWISTSRTALVLMAAILLSAGAWAGDINPVVLGGPHVLPKRAAGPVNTSAPAGAHLTYFGGRVVSNLHVIQVLWGAGAAGSADGQYLAQVVNTTTPSMASFYQAVLNSPYVDWLTEYDTNIVDNDNEQGTNQTIGRGSFAEQVTITPSNTSNPIDDAGIQTELANQIAAGHLPAPTTDAAGNNNTYYAVFFPHGLIITLGTGTSCAPRGFCAYHGTVAASGGIGEFYYGVHPDLQTGSGCDTGCGAGATFFDNQTSVASHEMVETITDGEVGLANTFDAPLAWYDTKNGEIGDICNAQQGSIAGYTVQLEFSNVVGNCIVSRSTTTPTPTATATATATKTATATSTSTPTATATGTQTVTATATQTATPTATRTATATPTATVTPTQTATSTLTATATATGTATQTATSTATATLTATATQTATATSTATPTSTATATQTATATATQTATRTATVTVTATSTPTATATATQTATSTVTATQTATPTATRTATATPTATATATQTATATASATSTATSTASATQTATPTASATATRTTTATPTSTATATQTATPTATSTATVTPTATNTASPTSTPTPAPDFAIAASPASETVRRGKTASYMVTVTRLSGFAGSVKLSVSGLPPRSNASFSPNRATTTSKLKVHASKGAADVGTFILTITGASGGVQHMTSVQLTVTK